jgi:shikimate kinase
MDYMNKNGKTIWLETPFDIIIDRLKDMRDDRPLLTSMSDQQLPFILVNYLKIDYLFTKKRIIAWKTLAMMMK